MHFCFIKKAVEIRFDKSKERKKDFKNFLRFKGFYQLMLNIVSISGNI